MKRLTMPFQLAAVGALLLAGAAQAGYESRSHRESPRDHASTGWRHDNRSSYANCRPACPPQRVTDLRRGHVQNRTIPVWTEGYWRCHVDACGRERRYWIPGYYRYETISVWVPDTTYRGAVAYGWQR